MRVVGVLGSGHKVADFIVGHGEHPQLRLYTSGWILTTPLTAQLEDGEITVTCQVRPIMPGDPRPVVRTPFNEEPQSSEVPRIHQRIGAYAIALSPRGLLGTVNSAITSAPGTWSLPGGGLDPGEKPLDGLLREVYEETGQSIVPGHLVALQSDHWIGRAPGGPLEDYHILRLIYSATCTTPSQPVVHDLGGSTQRADWVSVDQWATLRWTIGARQALIQHLT